MESTRNLTYLNAHQIDYGMVKLKQIMEYNLFESLNKAELGIKFDFIPKFFGLDRCFAGIY